MEHFYDGQIKRYLTQFMRLMSNFAYKDAKGKIVQIPVRYGDMNRQVSQIMMKNSENIVQSAPFVACYIKNMSFARDRLQDPTFVSKLNIRERAYDEQGQEYLNAQGSNYTVERLMPTPFDLEFAADIWTTNTDQKFQILEQLLVLFNPSMEVQTSNNYIDWTSLSTVELTNMIFTSRSVPQGLEQDIDIATLSFKTPIWLTTPAKVKKLGIITSIITNMFADPPGTIEGGAYEDSQNTDHFSGRVSISIGRHTLGNLGILVIDGTAKLLRAGESYQRNDTHQPGAKGLAKQIIVNGVATTNSRGQTAISISGLDEVPPAGSKIRLGGEYYTIVNYTGELVNLTLDLDSPLSSDLVDGASVFVQAPNDNPDNITIPVKFGPDVNWNSILDLYPGKFTASLSQIRLQKPDGAEIIGFISLDPTDDATMHINWDTETVYADTLIDINGLRSLPDGSLPPGFDLATGIGRVDAIIDPQTFNPRQYLPNGALDWAVVNARYLILEDINHVPQYGDVDYDGPDAWKNRNGDDFRCDANSIIQWNGDEWVVVFNSKTTQDLTYITNSRTGVQYVWDGFQWMKSFEGVYTAGKWRLVL
jgi:hypothetical protein